MTKRKKQSWQKHLASLFFLVLGGVCGFLGVRYLDSFWEKSHSPGSFLFSIAFFLAALYLTFFLQIILHEAGHLFFGLLSGYHFCSFRIGNLMWMKENGRLRLKKFSIAGTGGQCLMSPPDLVDGKMPFLLYNLGGPLVNLILGIVSLILYLLFDLPSYLSIWVFINMLIGFGFSFINGFPLASLNNDGSNTLALCKSNDALRDFWIQLKTNEQMAQGVRLKDMPKDWFTLPSEEKLDNPMTAVIAVLVCNRLMDEHRFEEAQVLIEELLHTENGIAELHRRLLINDYIYLELIGEHRPEKVEELLDKRQKKFMKSMKTFLSIIRTKYACALLGRNDADAAHRIQRQFEKQSASYPYASDLESEREFMKIAEERLHK